MAQVNGTKTIHDQRNCCQWLEPEKRPNCGGVSVNEPGRVGRAPQGLRVERCDQVGRNKMRLISDQPAADEKDLVTDQPESQSNAIPLRYSCLTKSKDQKRV